MLFWITISIAITSISAYGICGNPPRCAPGCFKLDERGCLLCACGVLNFHPGGYHGMPQVHMGGAGFVPGQMSGGGPFGSNQGLKSKPLSQCPGTRLCMQTCKGHYSLGNVGRNGCKTCTCQTTHVSTHVSSHTSYVARPQHHVSYAVVQHKTASCTGTKLCMMTCKSRYVLGAKGRDGCNTCTCAPQPTKAPAAKMSCMSTVMCMLTCKNGYSLGGTKSDGCQECSCVVPKVVTMAVTCSSSLKCSSGCNVGYKCGTDGCPTCDCIKPQVVGLKVVEVIQKQVTCSSSFSCSSKCSLGYKCGTDGCPTCECLVAVHTEQKPLVVTQPLKQPSKTETVNLLKQCPATFNCMTSCKEGYTLGSAGRDGCPACTCATVHKSECNDCHHHTTLSCDATISCMATCEHGYVLGDKDASGCPSCQCAQECNTCEAKKPAVMVVQQKETCNDCETHQVQLAQTVKEECHECETGGTAVMTGGTSGGSSGGMMGGGSGGGMMGGGSGGGMMGGGGGMAGGMTGGRTGMTGGNDCHPLPPDCHPSCIKYDVAHCRICECESIPGHGIMHGK